MPSNGPHGSLGLATASGWMTSDLFYDTTKHFIKHTNSSVENRTLLIYDNHDSHLSIKVIDLAKENGVIVLTLPPHCSHRMQPLDVTVYSSFKAHFSNAADAWMLCHPGIKITI